MSANTEIRSQTSHATHTLRAKIVGCEFEPGKRLHIASMAKTLNVSPGAVREALSRLSSEHLVQAIDQRGFRVAHLSLEDMIDIYDTRASVEADVVRISVEAGTPEWQAELRAAHDALTIFESKPIQQSAAKCHEAFHRTLVSGCTSPWRLKLFEILYMASERYRNFASFALSAKRDIATEHRQLCEAALMGDGDLAALLIRRHLARTRDILAETLSGLTEEGVAEIFSTLRKCADVVN